MKDYLKYDLLRVLSSILYTKDLEEDERADFLKLYDRYAPKATEQTEVVKEVIKEVPIPVPVEVIKEVNNYKKFTPAPELLVTFNMLFPGVELYEKLPAQSNALRDEEKKEEEKENTPSSSSSPSSSLVQELNQPSSSSSPEVPEVPETPEALEHGTKTSSFDVNDMIFDFTDVIIDDYDKGVSVIENATFAPVGFYSGIENGPVKVVGYAKSDAYGESVFCSTEDAPTAKNAVYSVEGEFLNKKFVTKFNSLTNNCDVKCEKAWIKNGSTDSYGHPTVLIKTPSGISAIHAIPVEETNNDSGCCKAIFYFDKDETAICESGCASKVIDGVGFTFFAKWQGYNFILTVSRDE